MTAKRTVAVSAVLVILLALLAGCAATEAPPPTEVVAAATQAPAEPTEASAPTEAPTEEEAEPVVLRVGGLQDVDCWNPFSCTAIYMWGDLVVEAFTDQGPASEGCPGLPAVAESWERSEDGRT